MQGELSYVKGAPSGVDNRVVGVYSFDDEMHPDLERVDGRLLYGVRIQFRDEAPDWMKPYITMLDLTGEDTPNAGYSRVVPGLGYKGTCWYVIVADKKHAEEAGLDVSDILNT